MHTLATNQLYKTRLDRLSLTPYTANNSDAPHPFRVTSIQLRRAVFGYVGFLSYATFLEYFAIETDALLSYDSVHYQDYSVNRAPIHRAFRAQADISGVFL